MKILTLTLSAAFDIHCKAEGLSVNCENLVEVTDFNAGGKGVNVSRALNSFGVMVKTLVVLGKENSDEFANKLKKENISLQIIETEGRTRENITIHTSDGNETRISFTAAEVPEDLIATVKDFTDRNVGKDDVIVMAGRLPSGIKMSDVIDYLIFEREGGVKVIIDSKSFTVNDLYLVKPYLIKPNEEEIAVYCGREVHTLEEAIEAGRELNKNGIENVMITLGKLGSVLVCNDGCYTVLAPEIEPVSTIGAGDSSIAGFIYGLYLSCTKKECLRYATAFGSAACMTSGTNPPERDVVGKLFDKVEFKD